MEVTIKDFKINAKETNNVNEIKAFIKTPKDYEALCNAINTYDGDVSLDKYVYSNVNITKPYITIEDDGFIAVFGLYEMSEEEKEKLKLKRENEVRDMAIAELAEMLITGGGIDG